MFTRVDVFYEKLAGCGWVGELLRGWDAVQGVEVANSRVSFGSVGDDVEPEGLVFGGVVAGGDMGFQADEGGEEFDVVLVEGLVLFEACAELLEELGESSATVGGLFEGFD